MLKILKSLKISPVVLEDKSDCCASVVFVVLFDLWWGWEQIRSELLWACLSAELGIMLQSGMRC